MPCGFAEDKIVLLMMPLVWKRFVPIDLCLLILIVWTLKKWAAIRQYLPLWRLLLLSSTVRAFNPSGALRWSKPPAEPSGQVHDCVAELNVSSWVGESIVKAVPTFRLYWKTTKHCNSCQILIFCWQCTQISEKMDLSSLAFSQQL